MRILAIGDFHGKFPEKLMNRIKNEKIDLVLSTGDYAGIDEWRPLLRKVFKATEKGKDISVEELLGKKKYRKLLEKDFVEGKIPLKELNKFKVRVFSVFGNGDWYKAFFNDYGKYYEKTVRKLRYIKNINRGKGSFKGMKIVGFGGYLDNDVYFSRKGRKAINDTLKQNRKRRKRYNEEKRKFMKLMKSKPDILLLHYNPYKCLDKMKAKGYALSGSNMGIGFFNRGIKKYSPLLVICGHMHENQGKCKIGKTVVINPGAASEGKAAIIELGDKVKNIKFLR